MNVINLAFALPNVTDELYCHGLPACVTDGLYTDPANLIQGVEVGHETVSMLIEDIEYCRGANWILKCPPVADCLKLRLKIKKNVWHEEK